MPSDDKTNSGGHGFGLTVTTGFFASAASFVASFVASLAATAGFGVSATIGMSSILIGARHSAGGAGASTSDLRQDSSEPSVFVVLRDEALEAEAPTLNMSATAATFPAEPVAIENAPSVASDMKCVAPSQPAGRLFRSISVRVVEVC